MTRLVVASRRNLARSAGRSASGTRGIVALLTLIGAVLVGAGAAVAAPAGTSSRPVLEGRKVGPTTPSPDTAPPAIVRPASSPPTRPVVVRHRRPPYCIGSYASDLVAVAPPARAVEEKSRYTFCVRSTATYQCAFYGPDGGLNSRRETRVAHGTGFAFRREHGYTYLLTNEHLTEWPYVSSRETPVESVPHGCKRVSQTVQIVDDENDHYAKDDISLQRVVVDPELDTAILKAQVKVPVIPFSLGQSAALKVGDAVRVRGFPLGAFQAVNGGKVISAREPDVEGKWDHYDFVTDAQLSTGNSGSPVLAVSCATRRFELVGMYHAGYKHGQALNVVVGIDEIRDLMTTLRPRKRKDPRQALTAADRARWLTDLKARAINSQLPFGGHIAQLRVAEGRLLYDFYPRRYPLVDWRLAVLEDLPGTATGFGRVGRIWFGSESGLAEKSFSELKANDQNLVANVIEEVRAHYRRVLQFRRTEPLAKKSRATYERLKALEREIGRGQSNRLALMRALADLAGQHAPGPDDKALPLTATTQPPPTAPPPTITARKPAPPAAAPTVPPGK